MDILSALKTTTKSIRDWMDDSLKNKVDKDGNKKLTDENYTSAEKTRVSEMVTGLAVLDNKLYLKNDNGIIETSGTTLPSGSGGGGSTSATITLINLGESNFTVAVGGTANLNFEYSSSETDEPATAYIYINDVLKKTYSIVTGENTLDIGDLLSEGINSIKLTVADIYSNSKSLQFSANAVNLRITSTFDDSMIYDGDIDIRYTPYGAVSKDVHLVIAGVDTVITTTSATNNEQSYVISADSLSHGAYDIEIYLSAVINDVEIVSNKLTYCIVVVDSGVTTPIISSVCTTTEIVQGEQLQINYVVYDPVVMNTEITLTVYQNDETYSQSKRIVDATRQTWAIRDLPIGTVALEIAYGSIKRTHTINVIKNDIDISIKQTGLEFMLSAEGKSNEDSDRDVWENNGVTTSFECINYESTGWIETESGTALRLFGQAKAVINFQPFLSDARQTGRTIELDFTIKGVNNKDAIAVSCMYGNVGFTVSADTATISSEQTSVNCKYTDEERVKVSFVIEPRNQYKLLSVFLNGILSGVKQYPDNDNFQQSTPQYIEIGSPYCSIDLYSIRSYKTYLNSNEVLTNYIASLTDVTEKLSVYEDNDIYDIYGNLSFEEVKERMPVCLITGSALPAYKGDKKNVTINFYHNTKPQLNYEDTAKINVQGTSSSIYPLKNFKFTTSNYHLIDVDKIETDTICLKADYAESTSSRNTGGAKFIGNLYGDAKIPPQTTDSRVRTTIYGYPCAVYFRTDSTETPQFVAKYNYNLDKSSYENFAFTSDYPDVFSVEFCNNTSDACRFHGEISDDWGDDFEYRYPDGYENINDSGFKEVHSWVVSTCQELATNEPLSENYIGADGTQYTNDTTEYRLAKFKKEFEDHFDINFALIYYVVTYFGMYIDSRCKNLFMTSFDRQKWYCYFYDMDTSYGINNEGLLTVPPTLEDTDLLDGADLFNGQDSTIWNNMRMAFPDEIEETYKNLRADGLLTYDNLIEYFINEQCKKYSAAMYNEDADMKYVNLARNDKNTTYLYQVRGSGEAHFRWFVKKRLAYCDGRWNCGDYPSDHISLRIYTPSTDVVVPANADITLTPYDDGYYGVKYKLNGTLVQQRAYANTPITFDAPNEVFNDTETAIYGASRISSLGDLSGLYCGTVDVSKATKLTEIIIGNGTEGYVNSNLKVLSVGTNRLLKKIDIRNCPNLTDPLQLTECPSIETVLAEGSGITSVELPKSGFLKTMHLPDTVTNLTITNQEYMEDFYIEGYDNLTTLRIEKVANVPVEDIMLNAPNLNRIRLIDVSWEAESEEALRQTIEKFESCLGLDASGNNISTAVVTGYVSVPSISDELFNRIYENFPNLVVDDQTGKPYIINFLDRSGESLYVTRVAEGADITDPITDGKIERPTDIITENAKYIYVSWSSLPTNVHSHYKITPVYETQYAVKYYNDTTLLHTEYVTSGSSAPDPVEAGLIEVPTKEGTDDLHYAFKGWDGSLLNITIPRTLNALWTNVYPVRFYTDLTFTTLHYTQWVIDGEDAHDPVTEKECDAPADIITENEKKLSFSHWSDIPKNVTKIEQVYAQYDIYWAARFLNDGKLYLLEWTLDGSDVVEPKDYFEDYTNPTRESTAQYDYAFSKWDGNFKAITEARDYNATYTNTVRRYRVRFYNDTTLLQTVKDVPYGSSATYTGSTPTKLGVSNPEEYIFKGWLPATENITGDTDYYALFKFTGYLFGKLGEGSDYGTVDAPNWDLINAYWDTIDNDIKTLDEDTLFVKYPIGGRMVIPVALSDGTVTADVEIIAHNHDSLADGTGLAPLTFFCVDLPQIQHAMNQNKGNVGGWKDSDMREFVNNDLLNALPGQLTAIIKPVTKLSDGGSNNKTIVETTDNCWIASAEEVGLTLGNSGVSGQGKLYDSIFSSDKDTRKKYITDDTSAGGWWTRSSYYSQNNSSLFYRVTTNGTSYTDIAFNSFYVAFGFCI